MLSRRSFVASSLAASGLICASELPAKPAKTTVLVVGAGAGGAAISWRLASLGFSVTCLEQGGYEDYAKSPAADPKWELLRQREYNPDPNVRNRTEDYPIDVAKSDIHPLMYSAVGGSTIMWSCHAPRFHPSDFAIRTLDGVGDDWPIRYQDLEPFYDLNESISGVAGLNGDPAYPDSKKPRLPPLPIGLGAEKIATALNDLGWHWWPADVQVNSVAHGAGRGICNHCGPCELGCPLRAKGSTDVTYWPKALKSGAQLITNARVTKLISRGDQVLGAEFLDLNGQLREQRADVVVLAGNGIGTPRLLLLSATSEHPNGLANSSDMVGRNLMFHPVGISTGVFDDALDGYRGVTACSIASKQFCDTRAENDFTRGYMLQMLRSLGPVMTALGGYGVPQEWGRGHRARFDTTFNHTASIAVVCEDLPEPDNRVTLDAALEDSSGLPAPQIHYRVSSNSKKMLKQGRERCEEILTLAGAGEVRHIPLLQGAGFHLMGTARMGEDPKRFVTNEWGRTHDIKNLFIADGSLFTSAAAVNPTATIQALALRVGTHIAKSYV